jgi:hypothetical protein
MSAIRETILGHAVGALWLPNNFSYYAPDIEYVDRGDPYRLTVLRTKNGVFKVGTIGEWLERHPDAADQPAG